MNTKKMGRVSAILAVAGFIAAPAWLTGCDDTKTSKRTTTTTTQTPAGEVTEKHIDKVTVDKDNNGNNTNNNNENLPPPPPPTNPK